MPACPKCKGEKGMEALVTFAEKPCEFRVIPCRFCDATGEVTPEKVEWAAWGERLRQRRLSLHLGITQAAKMLRMTGYAMSRMQQGLDCPAELERRLDELEQRLKGA